jgi:hypothetical protein
MLQPSQFCRIFALLFVFAALDIAAQEPAPPTASPTSVTAVATPDERADWTMEVRTSGGLTGKGAGGFTLTSAGALICSAPKPCVRTLQPTDMQSLAAMVRSMDLLKWMRVPGSNRSFHIPVPESVCSDCIVTTMVLSLRDSKTLEWTYTATWDSTTQPAIPFDIRQLFQTAASFAK